MTSIAFFGSDRFSAVVLSELIAQNYAPQLVVTDPPRSLGRKQIITPNEVENIAKEQKLNVLYYQANNDELINYITKHNPVGLTASFPHLFPPHLIKLFPNQLYNLHPSLLPQYRNVAPGPYAIALGDTETGITLQHIDEQIDHGSIVAQVTEPILPTDTTPSLLTRLFIKGVELFCQHVSQDDLKRRMSPLDLPDSCEHCKIACETCQKRQNNSETSQALIFTRRLTRDSGYLEWDVIQKLLQDKALKAGDTKNPLIKLRLTHHPERTQNILPDLIRALDGYEKVWTTAPTKSGDLHVSLALTPDHKLATINHILIQIPGKPRPISFADFARYYL